MKSWKSIDEQVSLLKSRGMEINDDMEAQKALQRFGYYRLSGYWYPFRQRNADDTISDDFRKNTNLSEVIDLCIFDKRLRLLSLDALERIELALRVDVAYALGKRSSVGHTDIKCLDGGVAKKLIKNGNISEFKKWSNKYKSQKKRSMYQKSVEHNINLYTELPIWVAIEVFDFGSLSHLFKMMRRFERDTIAAKYGLPSGKVLEKWLKSLYYIRNVSAHHERLWNNNINDSSDVPIEFSDLAKTNQYRSFRYLSMMQFFLNQICPKSTWKNRMREHLLSFPTPSNQAVSVEDMGIVEGWEQWPLWRV
jgi:abortive infection bacteriophage resistance protein